MSDNTGFVYKCLSCGYIYIKAAGQPLRCPECDSKERDHTHTIDCQKVLERILNKKDCDVYEFLDKPDICEGCLQEIDLTTCHCGSAPGRCDNHNFVPMGCNCHNLSVQEMLDNVHKKRAENNNEC